MTNAVKRAWRAGAGLALTAVLGAMLAGCGPDGGIAAGKDDRRAGGGRGASSAVSGTEQSVPKVSEAAIRISPTDGAQEVRPDGGLQVDVDKGSLTDVRVQTVDGLPVEGELSADRRRWQPKNRLALSTLYIVDALAADALGRRAAKHAVFTTKVPKHTFIGFYNAEAGATVGTGMIVSVVFNRPIIDRAAVERAIEVRAVPPVRVAAHWFGRRRVDLRPRSFWRPGTDVTLRLRLRDVEGAPGVYGTQTKDVRFHIGRRQVSTVDIERHTMTVRRNGRVLRTLPVSAGGPDHPTYNGMMVIAEKLPLTRMNGSTVGFGGEYDIPDVPHAMRLTRSGTFIHGNYWTNTSVFGRSNTSHGCIGLYDVKGGGSSTPAGWLFEHTLVGDIVKVIDSHKETVAPDNGMSGWNLGWREWLAGSAL